MRRDGASSVVLQAYRAYKNGRFLETAALLDTPSIASSRDPYIMVLCSMAYLQLNKFTKADELLSKVESFASSYPLLNQLKAFLYLKAAPDFESAISYYGELLAKYPNDKTLARSLRRLRKVRNFTEFQRNAKIDNFVKLEKPIKSCTREFQPIIKNNTRINISESLFQKRLLYKGVLFVAVVAMISGIAILLWKYHSFFVHRTNEEKLSQYKEIDQVTLDSSGFDLIERISKKKQPELYLSSKMIIEDFTSAKWLIKKQRYNEALKKINKIIHSNANMSVKERASFLKRFILAIDERQWEEIPYSEIMQKPYLYGGYSIMWKGKIANLRKKGNTSAFNLLVDYRTEAQFSGIAEIFCENCSNELKNGDLVVVKGIFFDIITSGMPYLRVKEYMCIQ